MPPSESLADPSPFPPDVPDSAARVETGDDPSGAVESLDGNAGLTAADLEQIALAATDETPPDEPLFRARVEESATIQHGAARVGRNDPCPCGSGKKFKKCCIAKFAE